MYILSIKCIIVVCLLVSTVPINILATPNHFASFKDNALINYPKCCQIDSALRTVNNTSVKCIDTNSNTNRNNLIEISSPVISNFSFENTCDDSFNCVDFIQVANEWKLVRLSGATCKLDFIQDYNYLPKCCPQDFSYDPTRHKCVQSNGTKREQDGYLQVRKIGLSACPAEDYVIVDVEESFIIDDGNKRIRTEFGESFNYGDYCIDRKHDTEGYLVRACMKSRDFCGHKGHRCLWKCCPDGEIYFEANKTRRCVVEFDGGINIAAISDDVIQKKDDTNFGIITTNLNTAPAQFKHRKSIHFKILEEGNTELRLNNILNTHESIQKIYCIEHVRFNATTLKQSIFLFNFGPENPSVLLKSIMLFNSALFALITAICYALLPEMQNLHGKCIIMECLFLCLASAILWITNGIISFRVSLLCNFLGYGTIYAFLGLFSWLNIICVDIWMTFGFEIQKVITTSHGANMEFLIPVWSSLKGFAFKNKKSELRKFLMYCVYGFGVPTVIVGFMLFLQAVPFLPSSLIPKIGNKQCYFDSYYDADYFTFFITPMMIMLIVNVVLFVKTIVYCIKVKNEIERMRNSGKEQGTRKMNLNSDIEKMFMFLKMFLIMGILWTFEVISSFISFQQHPVLSAVEKVFDTINSAKGVIIFFILIFKRKVLFALLNRFGIKTQPQRQTTEMSSLTMTTSH